MEPLALVCGTFLFAGVDEIVVERILADSRCTAARLTPGQALPIRACLGFLLEGQVQVTRNTPAGGSASFWAPGACFGTQLLFRPEATALLTAVSDAEVLLLPEALMRTAMQRNPVVTENYIRYLTEQIDGLEKTISSFTAGRAEQRLAQFLLTVPGHRFSGSMATLSRQLCLSRATLYRVLAPMEEQGLIRRVGKTIEIRDPAGLRRLTEGE